MRAVRGATTVDADRAEDITSRVQELLLAMLDRNQIDHDDIISVFFTATPDLVSIFPALAARGIGFGDIPLICATEIAVVGSTPHCIRVMMHIHSSLARSAVRHVYLHGAAGLRDDLPG
jgi:chorismate mutase